MISHASRAVLDRIMSDGAEFTARQLVEAGYRMVGDHIVTPDGFRLSPTQHPDNTLVHRVGPLRMHEKSKLLASFRRLSEAAE